MLRLDNAIILLKTCIPQLSPYIFNGQVNATLLNEGDGPEVVLTFYANQDYRLLICSESLLGNIEFRLYDTQNTLLFDNKNMIMQKCGISTPLPHSRYALRLKSLKV